MAILEPIEHVLPGGTAMEAQDDLSLLNAIAQRRDKAAFDALHERYQKRAFNLAFRVLRNPSLAQDAVQEAMLAIWISAKSIRPNSNAKDWIMRIVMNKSINLGSSQKRSAKREDRVAMEQSRSECAVAEEAESNELIAVLRRHLDQLPDLERTLLAYSYCTSMPQREIAKLVGVSQMTVSIKIQQALDRLRTNLTKAGVAAVVPLLSSENLYEAMTTGQECPAGMMEGTMQRIKSHENAGQFRSRRAAAVRRGGWILPACIVAVLAAGLGGAWWLARGQGPAVQSAKTAIQPAVTSEDKPIHARWSFEKGPAQGLKILQGNWNWQLIGGTGVMVAPEDSVVRVGLPIDITAHPLVVRMKANLDLTGDTMRFAFGAYWINEALLVASRGWHKVLDLNSANRHVEYSYVIYFIDRYEVTQRDGQIITISEYKSPYPSRRIGLNFQRLNIEEIAIDSLSSEEMPEFLRNIPQEIAKLGIEPNYVDENYIQTKSSVKP